MPANLSLELLARRHLLSFAVYVPAFACTMQPESNETREKAAVRKKNGGLGK
jgi:hypothetical protein